jgi:homopolymeric O-antigen transport system permease protein
VASDSIAQDRPITIRRAGARVSVPVRSIADLIHVADLFRTLTEHRIRVRYKQSALGWLWAILQPLSMMLIFTLVFGRIARVSTDHVPYSLFAFTGLLIWSSVSTSLINGTHALVSHAQILTKVYFPRELLPLSYVAAALFDLAVGSLVLLGLLAWHEHPLSFGLLLALPAVFTVTVLIAALVFALSALNVWFRDIGLAIPLLTYLWMFSTPIAYPLSAVPARYQWLFQLNPLTGIIETFRRAVLANQAPTLSLLAVPIVTATVLLPVSYVLFKRVEATMADVV